MTSLLARFRTRLDLHQSPMHSQAMAGIGWQTHGAPGSQIYLLPLGPVSTSKMQRPRRVDYDLIHSLRISRHTLGFYLEPGLSTRTHGQPGSTHKTEPFAHSATSLIDLTPSLPTILSSFASKTRYNIRLATRDASLAIVSHPLARLSEQAKGDLLTLRSLWSQSKGMYGYELKFVTSVLASFRHHGTLHLAYHHNDPVAALLVLTCDRVATYWAAFTTPLGNHLHAPTLLTWTSLQAAKSEGCDIYDFGGVYDPRYPRLYRKWQGFTKFKAGFHPTYLEYPPSTLQLFW